MTITEGTLPVGTTGKNLDTTVVEQTDGPDMVAYYQFLRWRHDDEEDIAALLLLM